MSDRSDPLVSATTDPAPQRTFEIESDADYPGGRLVITITDEGVVFDRYVEVADGRWEIDNSTYQFAQEIFDDLGPKEADDV